MNIFQKRLQEREIQKKITIASTLQFSNLIEKLIKIKPEKGYNAGASFVSKKYTIYASSFWIDGKHTGKFIWMVKYTNEKCTPNGCPIRKPIVQEDVIKEIKQRLQDGKIQAI